MSFIVKGVGSVLGAKAKKKASKNAQAAYNAAQAEAIATSKATQDAQQARLDPYSAAGRTALSQISEGTQAGGKYVRPFEMKDFNVDPGYAFRKEEGLRALDRTLASRGSVFSGAQLRGTEDYAQNIASEEYGRAYDRYNTNVNNDYTRTNNLAQLGFAADTGIADTLGTEGRDIRGSQIDIGGNNATGIRERGAIKAGMIDSLATEVVNGINAVAAAAGGMPGGIPGAEGGGGGSAGGLTSLLSALGIGGTPTAAGAAPDFTSGALPGSGSGDTNTTLAGILKTLGVNNTAVTGGAPSSSGTKTSLSNLSRIFSKGR